MSWGRLGAGFLVAFALGMRARSLDWGFPEVFEEAIPTREAIEFWGEPGGRLDLNPHFFKYPSLTFYLNFVAQAAWYLVGSVQGTIESLNGFRQVLREDLASGVHLGRWINAILGALAVLPVMGLARRLGGRGAAWIAGALWAVLPVAVLESRVVSPDMALALFTAAALAAATRFAERGARSDALACGVWLGLATAAKYPGALLIVALITAQAVAAHRGGAGRIVSGLWLQGLLVAAAVFAAATPYVLLDPGTALEDVLFERRHMSLGHLGREDGRAWTYYLGRALPGGWTPVVASASLLGLGMLLADRERRGRTLPGAVFALVTLVVLGSWTMAAPRYALPLAPLGVAWSSAGIALAAERWERRRRHAGRVVWGVAAATLLAWPVLGSVRQFTSWSRPDSRLAAAEWIRTRVPDGSSLLLERYGPEPDGERVGIVYLPFHGIRPHLYDAAYSSPLYATFDYAVLSSGVHARYQARPREYPAQVRFYIDLERAFREVASFPAGEYLGPTVRILQRREEVPFPGIEEIPEAFFEQLQGNGPMAEFLSTLGTSLVRQGEEGAGFRLLRKAVDIDPGNASTWGNLGVMELERGRHSEAYAALRRAREIDPGDARAAYNLGQVFVAMGELRQAADAYRETVLIDPAFEPAYIAMARTMIEDDRFGDAASVLRHFLDRFPRSPRRDMAERALAELRLLGPGKP